MTPGSLNAAIAVNPPTGPDPGGARCALRDRCCPIGAQPPIVWFESGLFPTFLSRHGRCGCLRRTRSEEVERDEASIGATRDRRPSMPADSKTQSPNIFSSTQLRRGALALGALLGLMGCAGGGGLESDSSSDGSDGLGDGGGAPTHSSSGSGAGKAIVADFFVATNGNDKWTGKLAAPNAKGTDGPFATIGKAKSAVLGVNKTTRTTPIVVMLRGGTYELGATLAFTSADSGTAKAPVVYEAYPGEVPILSGGAKVTGFHKSAAGKYTATLPSDAAFAQLWVDGSRRYRPRANAGDYLRIAGRDSQNALDTLDMAAGTDLSASWHDLTAVELVVFEKWTVSRLFVKSVDSAAKKATTTAFTNSSTDHGFIAGHRYLAENVKEALTSAGQWYLDRTTHVLTYLTESGEDPTGKTEVVRPVLSHLVTTDGLMETTFSGITFSHTSWATPSAGYPAAQSLWDVPAAILVQNPVHVVFDGCTIAHVGANGIDFQDNDGWSSTPSDPYSAEFINGAIYDTGAGGVRIGPSHATSDAVTAQGVHVANNVVSGGGRFLPSAQGILVGDSHHDVVENNEVFDYYQTGIAMGFCFASGAKGTTVSYATSHAHDNTVRENLVHDIGRGVTSDMGGIYTLTCQTKGNQIVGNVIHDVSHYPGEGSFAPGYGGNGLYFDQGTSNIAANDNLVYRVSGNGFQQNFGRTNTVTNNVFAYAKNRMMDHTFYESSGLEWMTFAHNVVAFDKGSLLGLGWECPSGDCTGNVDLHDNLYWDAAKGGSVTFNLQTPAGHLTLAEWQSTHKEDTGSLVADPKFVDPSPPGDDFTLKAGSPAFGIGFVAFDPTKAGRTSTAIQPPDVPAGAPLAEPADPSTYY
jgi:Right handed beta helix region